MNAPSHPSRLLLLALFFLLPAPAEAQGRGAAQALVPAAQTTRTDALGFTWDIDPRLGGVRNGSNGSFGGACYLQVNGANFQARQPMMTADGSELVLSSVMGGIDVTRRVRLDVKAAGLRTLDSFRNTGAQAASVSVVLHTNLGYQAGTVITDQGLANPSSLGKNESGLVVGGGNAGSPWVLFHLCGPRSKEKPTILNNSNYEFQFQFLLNIAPGKTVSLLHSLAQRTVGATDVKSLAALFKPFLSRSWTRDLPDALRHGIVNLGAGSATGAEAPSLELLPEELVALRGNRDVLALGEETRLQGVVACAKLSVESAFGTVEMPIERVAAILGGKRHGGRARLFLRDGQALSGTLATERLRFTMPSGAALDLAADDVDRLILSARADPGAADPGFWGLIETLDGDRLAVAADPALHLGVATPWGPRTVELAELDRLTFLETEQPGHQVILKDGSRFFAFLNDDTWSFHTLLFGVRELRPADVRTLVTVGARAADDAEAVEIGEPHLVLIGGNVLVGRIDLPALHLLSAGKSVPVPPDQIRALHNLAEGGDLRPGETAQFQAELWDGGVVTGMLAEAMVPLRRGEWIGRVPTRSILDAAVPVPALTDAMRERIAGLVRDLGHSEWEKREAASRDLEELGSLARPMLAEGLDQATDPEVRKRLKALLDKAER